MAKGGELDLRAYVMVSDDSGDVAHYLARGPQSALYGGRVWVRAIKLYADGALGSRGAALLEPYSDDDSAMGFCNYTQDEFTALVRAAYQRNIQVGAHVIGDRAADMLTTAIETVYKEEPKPDPRFRMIHLTVLNEDIIQRIRKLPVIVDTQPLFIHTDMPWMSERVGERSKYVNAWGRLLKEGMILTGGSDAPGTGHNPWEGIYAAVTRKNLSGAPEGGWHPENCISVYEALRMYTANAAYSSFEENIKGTITEGKLADFVVLDEDIFAMAPEKIKDIKVRATYLGGRAVYERD